MNRRTALKAIAALPMVSNGEVVTKPLLQAVSIYQGPFNYVGRIESTRQISETRWQVTVRYKSSGHDGLAVASWVSTAAPAERRIVVVENGIVVGWECA